MIDTDLFARLLPVFALAGLHTVELTLVALAGGLLVGFGMNALRELGPESLRAAYWTYTAVWRGMPFLVHLFICYFGLTSIGLTLDPFEAAALALALYGGAYFAEIFRACWQSIPVGQVEAAYAMGLSRRHVFLHIQCPQALRASLPLITNQTIILIKESSLASIITYPELTLMTTKVVSETYVYVEPYLMLALSYWILTAAVSRIGRAISNRVAL